MKTIRLATLGQKETGGRVSLPVFRELMLNVYRDGLVGPALAFPDQMEQRIARYLQADAPDLIVNVTRPVIGTDTLRGHAPPEESEWLLHHGAVFGANPTTKSPLAPRDRVRER